MQIKISNSFLIVLALMIAINGLKLFFFIMISCLIHEFAHFFVIKLQKLKIEQFSLNFLGGSIKCHALKNQSDINLIFVYISGILSNIILGFLCCNIANQGFYSRNFFILSGINFLLAFFNALPIKFLDGYFVLYHFILLFSKNFNKTEIFCNNFSIFCNFLLIIAGFYYSYHANFSILLISFCLLFSNFKNYTFF